MSATSPVRKRPRHAPQRTCVVCRRTADQRELVRLAKPAGGLLTIDARARTPGRGAYLCRSHKCWADAVAPDQLGRALRQPITDQDRDALHQFARTSATAEPERDPQ